MLPNFFVLIKYILAFIMKVEEEVKMNRLFEPVSEKEFYESVDRGIEQAKKGQRKDAHEAMREIADELEAGYRAMKTVKSNQNRKLVINS